MVAIFEKNTAYRKTRTHALCVIHRIVKKYVRLSEEQVEFLFDLTPSFSYSKYPELLWKATSEYVKNALRKAEEIVECFVQKLS